jgi:hypothetical protein
MKKKDKTAVGKPFCKKKVSLKSKKFFTFGRKEIIKKHPRENNS